MTAWTLTYDCKEPAVVAEFWKTALGHVDAPPPQGFASWEAWFVACDVPEDEWDDGAALVDPAGVLPRLSFLKVPEPKTAKNRLHIDIRVAGEGPWEPAERERLIRELWPRLEAAGATYVREESYDGALGHVVMLDPEGNEFCVA